MNRTRSKDHALDVLFEFRARLIRQGREVAIELCEKEGAVTAQRVREEMAARGMLDGYDGRDNWLGAVFGRGKRFRKVGAPQVRSQTINARPAGLWALADASAETVDAALARVTAEALVRGWSDDNGHAEVRVGSVVVVTGVLTAKGKMLVAALRKEIAKTIEGVLRTRDGKKE